METYLQLFSDSSCHSSSFSTAWLASSCVMRSLKSGGLSRPQHQRSGKLQPSRLASNLLRALRSYIFFFSLPDIGDEQSPLREAQMPEITPWRCTSSSTAPADDAENLDFAIRRRRSFAVDEQSRPIRFVDDVVSIHCGSGPFARTLSINPNRTSNPRSFRTTVSILPLYCTAAQPLVRKAGDRQTTTILARLYWQRNCFFNKRVGGGRNENALPCPALPCPALVLLCKIAL
ncbi:hypothetical protein HDK77DRAFT_457327 [Phyllosticta capitalensis]